MVVSAGKRLTYSQAVTFFLSPEEPLQRQYEALRAFFADQQGSADVADRFGYSPGSFRVLCHQFRHDDAKRAGFFRQPQHGPHSAPARDRVRERAVALRKRNLSVYDIQRELAHTGQAISINALAVLLREEGFSRLPRRRDEERPATLKPEMAEVADVRRLDLSPRSFRTALAGVFLFVPLLQGIDLASVVRAGRLPGSRMIPAQQAVRTLLALKLLGSERKSHVMDLVFDPAIALFAGLNVVPKRSYLAAYSSSVDHRANVRVMDAWFRQTQAAGLPLGSSLDLDFHTVPAHTAEEPLEKHYVSSRSRRQQGILVFLAREAEQRVFRYAHAGIPKADQANEILEFVAFWKRHTGRVPTELVFDSQLTTHENLAELNRQGIFFITLRRRSRKMLAAIYGRPASDWRRITLDSLTRTFRTPRVIDERVPLRGYGDIRQLTWLIGHELGHHAAGHLDAGRRWVVLGGWLPWLYLWYSRRCEFTCDRVGLYCAGSLELSNAALANLAVGSQLADKVNLAEAIRQWEGHSKEFFVRYRTMYSTHPQLLCRLAELRTAAASLGIPEAAA